MGSAKESENHLYFVHDMGWIDRATFAVLDAELTEVRKMLFALARRVRERLSGDADPSRSGPAAGEQ